MHRVEPHPKRFVTVNGERMAYIEGGAGDRAILFLHGNPTSSYLWRNVMPAVAPLGRCIAPDLIGMGDSAKLDPAGPGTYRFATHREFSSGFIERVIGPSCPITLVLHDWGSALGFDWANHHRDRVKGIAYMEAIVRPLTWDEWPEGSRHMFRGLRSGGRRRDSSRQKSVRRTHPSSIDLENAGPCRACRISTSFRAKG
jgi:haloalkane dehalogenase